MTATTTGTPTARTAPAAPPGRPAAAPTPALADAAGTLTGAALTRRVLAAAGELRGRGVGPGDRVLVKGDNSVDYVVALLALMHLDASLVPVDHRQTAADGRFAARRARARWLLTRPADAADFPGECVLDYPGLGARSTPADGEGDGGEVDLAAWFARTDAVVLWSSGTTGPPKGIVKSGRALHDNTRRTIAAMGYRADDVLAPLLPFSHQYGLSVVLLWWLAGCTLAVTPYQRLDVALAQSVEHGVTAVDAAPSTYHSLLGVVRRRPELRAALRRVRVWGVGGAPLPAPLAEAFPAVLGRPLLDGYGLTELGNVALATPQAPTGCGRPLPGVEVRVVRPDGAPAAPGELGGIEVRSPGLMEGRLREDGTLDPVPQGSWYPTADLGHFDAEGHLYVVGRNQAVHRSGFTLYPESLERKAEACGRQVKALAVEDLRRGCTLHFVVADPDGGSPAQWRRRMAPHLAEYEQPNAVHVVDRFPLSANGKTDTAALRRMIGVAAA
ncbi:class I adenylate-forming enzyme family protein [Streptomyces sp. NRRL F-2664]|uniref:class I adenylate-forming enzyme family protein n=1 Tax=Streptomyces sp. NRRL F-2664 TaxID=1463842 RepID=UPI000997B35D|nr:class I adenylate-forming enzyme family protein [Streptomyces sp. NRRL F-2664]